MAGDLIPPPSPAGRPPADAMAGVRATSDETPPLAPEAAPAAAAGEAPFRAQFGFIWGALAGVVVCVAAVTAVLVLAPGEQGPPLARGWSSWEPSTSRMLPGAEEIAERVSRRYTLDSGDPLVTVHSGPIAFEDQLLGVAVRPKGGELQVLDGDGVLYLLETFNSTDKAYSSADGKRLLMREALELALYSFRYLDDVTMVAVVLPPDPKAEDATKESRALFYRPGDLLPQLQVPLARTLSPTTPRLKTMEKAEAARVDSLALRNRFDYSIQPLDGDLDYLVLSQPDVID
jgi:hypothetical protein